MTKPPRSSARRDALSTGVVISEVYGGGGVATSAYKYDFVELFNRGTVAVDVSNWSVQYAGATAGSWQPTSLGNFGLLQPGQSLLVRMGGSASGAGLDLPAHDVTGASLMSATTGKVALVSSTGGLNGNCPSSTLYVDLVGYGAMANCAEAAETPDTSGQTSVSRIGNGCTETDSNANDFTVSGPLPRNSTAGNVVCGSTPPVDAGTNPVDAGTNPVDAGSCALLTTFPIAFQTGGYAPADETTFGEFSSTAGVDVLTFEAYFGAGLTLPSTKTFTSATKHGTCEVCALLSRGCDSMGVCTKEFFAQGGTGSVTVATQDERDGRLTGSLNAVRFVEWDFTADEAVVGGECVVLSSQNLNVSWGAGPTGGGGGTTDAGTGGGSGGGGGGTADAGTEQDGGTGGGGGGKLGGMSGCSCSSGGEAALAFLAFAMLRRRR